MKVSTLLSLGGVVGVLFGLGFLLVPSFMLPQYGMLTEPHTLLMARYFGATLLTWGLIMWFSRGVRDDAALRALLMGGSVGWALGLVVSLWSVLAGLQNAMGWLSVVLYGAFLIGGLYFLSSPARRA